MATEIKPIFTSLFHCYSQEEIDQKSLLFDTKIERLRSEILKINQEILKQQALYDARLKQTHLSVGELMTQVKQLSGRVERQELLFNAQLLQINSTLSRLSEAFDALSYRMSRLESQSAQEPVTKLGAWALKMERQKQTPPRFILPHHS